jgi:ribose 1,5-bisphosphokinase PhnN
MGGVGAGKDCAQAEMLSRMIAMEMQRCFMQRIVTARRQLPSEEKGRL